MDPVATETQAEILKSPASLTSQEAIGILVEKYFQRELVEEFLRLENSSISYDDLLGLINSEPFKKRFDQAQIQTIQSWWSKDGILSVPQLLKKVTDYTIMELGIDLQRYEESDSKNKGGSFNGCTPEMVAKAKQCLPVLDKFFKTRRIF